MDGLRRARKQARRLISQRGSVPDRQTIWSEQAKYRGPQADIERLDPVPLDPLQTPTGDFYFLVGYSALGGPDVIR